MKSQGSSDSHLERQLKVQEEITNLLISGVNAKVTLFKRKLRTYSYQA